MTCNLNVFVKYVREAMRLLRFARNDIDIMSASGKVDRNGVSFSKGCPQIFLPWHPFLSLVYVIK